MKNDILHTISSPDGIKKLPEAELEQLAAEIREELIEVTSKNGGHLASNLGAVELTLALHRVYDCPKDKIVFDVGHQAYIHKMLTGRIEKFATIRTENGLSGFPKRAESEFDAFDTGHSSTSVSAALGLLRAAKTHGEDINVAAVIGDGALTGGMVFEALNDLGQSELPLVIIFNDNNMSISRNVGALSKHLTDLRSSRGYQTFKKKTDTFIRKSFRAGDELSDALARFRDRVKYFLLPNNALFEDLGIKYWGPVDGHDIGEMTEAFRRAKELGRPVVVHVITKKGKGYEPAEHFPEKFHGIGRFDPATGLEDKKSAHGNSETAGEALCEAAKDDENVVAICAAMPISTGLTNFSEFYPDRFYDVGIAEQHAVTMAAGMAAGGMHPAVMIYSSFLQRAYDQLLHDVCLQKLPVLFGIDRAGLVGEDGETHQGVYDIAYLLSMPYMQIWSPSTQNELSKMIKLGLRENGPVAIRYSRSPLPQGEDGELIPGVWQIIKPICPLSVIASGRILENVKKACDGLDVGLVNVLFIRPMDDKVLAELRRICRCVITVEDGLRAHGMGKEIAGKLYGVPTICLGVPDEPVKQASIARQDEYCGLSVDGIREKILQCIGEKNEG